MLKAWHFATTDRCLGYGDYRPIVIGETLKVDGEIELCKRGLHGSVRIIDALQYARGPVLYRVKLDGNIIYGDDKLVASERTAIAGGIDATDMLKKFTRQCALDVIHLWDAPEIVVRYLKTGDESIRATARDAARDDAWATARDDAWATVRDAAGGIAAWAAAWAAVWTESWADAWADAWTAAEAARDSTRDAQNRRLTRMANKLLNLEG